MKIPTLTVAALLAIATLWWQWPITEPVPNTDISVLIVGAGAAGLSAGMALEELGIGYTIIEASDTYGGRLKETTDFSDFSIDLGAEWIHEDPAVLNEMANQDILQDIAISVYDPRELLIAIDGELEDYSEELVGYKEWKFKDSTWFNFVSTYIFPSVAGNIIYNQPVSDITYDENGVSLETSTGETYQADYVIVTVPVTILQREYITFTPPLPEQNIQALNKITMAPGFKAFIEFSEQFYPEMFHLEEPDPEQPHEGRLFYDATFDKDTEAHVLGILSNGAYAEPYIDLEDEEIIKLLLAELDAVYEGTATATYQNHIVQNWSQEPFIQGTYTTDTTGFYWKTLRDASAPVADRVFFAGAAYDSTEQGTVPGAWRSAQEAVADIIEVSR